MAQKIGWPEAAGLTCAGLAVVELVWRGGVLSALALCLAGVMGWTSEMEKAVAKRAAAGKPSTGPVGRLVIAIGLVGLAGILLPSNAPKSPQAVEQPAPASPAAVPVSEASNEQMAPKFGKMDAIEACKRGVASRASHPSTVEFPVLDYDFRELGGGDSKLLMSAKARNGFGLQITFDVECRFVGSSLEDVIMSEAAPS